MSLKLKKKRKKMTDEISDIVETETLNTKFDQFITLFYLKFWIQFLNNLQYAIVNYFGTVQNKFIDYETVSKLTVFNVAASLQLTNQEKYQLISHRYPQLFLLNQIKFIVHIINTEQQIKDRFIEN